MKHLLLNSKINETFPKIFTAKWLFGKSFMTAVKNVTLNTIQKNCPIFKNEYYVGLIEIDENILF